MAPAMPTSSRCSRRPRCPARLQEGAPPQVADERRPAANWGSSGAVRWSPGPARTDLEAATPVANDRHDFVQVRLQHEVTAIQELDTCVRGVLLKRRRAIRPEDLIVLPPDR